MAKWHRFKAGTIADTDVLKAIVKRVFLKSAENVADLWIRDDGAFMKIRGFRGSFGPGNIFQVKIPTSQFREGVERYINELLSYLPAPDSSRRAEEDWMGWVLEVRKNGPVLWTRHDALGFLTEAELKSVRETLVEIVSRIDTLLEERDGREL